LAQKLLPSEKDIDPRRAPPSTANARRSDRALLRIDCSDITKNASRCSFYVTMAAAHVSKTERPPFHLHQVLDLATEIMGCQSLTTSDGYHLIYLRFGEPCAAFAPL